MARSQNDLNLQCACGWAVRLRAEQIPEDWSDDTGLNIHRWVFDRMRCTSCGRRGRPQFVTISPVENRTKATSHYPGFCGTLAR